MNVQPILSEARQLLESWQEIQQLAGKATHSDSPISPADEQRFLDLKSGVSKLQRALAASAPKDLVFNDKQVAELLKNSVSLQHLRGLPEKDRGGIANQSHDLYIQLVRMVGGLDFIAAGWRPEVPKKKVSAAAKKKQKKTITMIVIAVVVGLAAAKYLGFL
jgi:hypothetical protein